ncbi:MAG: ribosomal-processing cysteine protease Prp [Lachnospiraceae bacterium]|jgi:uncharacterized protein YsxB (DUF464 family)
MIEIIVYSGSRGCEGFTATGHAGYAEEGYDIICASASVLMINTANSIEKLTGDKVVAEADEGYLKVEFPEGLSHDGAVLMDAMMIGLEEIQNNYGKKYLSILQRRKH